MLRSLAHRLGHVDTDRPPVRAYMGRRQQEIRTSPASDVDNGSPYGNGAIA